MFYNSWFVPKESQSRASKMAWGVTVLVKMINRTAAWGRTCMHNSRLTLSPTSYVRARSSHQAQRVTMGIVPCEWMWGNPRQDVEAVPRQVRLWGLRTLHTKITVHKNWRPSPEVTSSTQMWGTLCRYVSMCSWCSGRLSWESDMCCWLVSA